jgi:hypothetical protein
MAASSISFTLLRLLFIEFNRPEHADFRHRVLLAGLIVPFLVCLSRLYLGMHSVLDVLVGSLYALGLSLLFLQVSHLFQSLVRHSFTNGLFIYLLIFLAGLAYPCNNRQLAQQSTARSDTFLILGETRTFHKPSCQPKTISFNFYFRCCWWSGGRVFSQERSGPR